MTRGSHLQNIAYLYVASDSEARVLPFLSCHVSSRVTRRFEKT
jgi:hypothetical protein